MIQEEEEEESWASCLKGYTVSIDFEEEKEKVFRGSMDKQF